MFFLENEELDLFYLLDQKKYVVSKNIELQTQMRKVSSLYKEEYIQDFIDKLACWYLVKLPDTLLADYQIMDYYVFKMSNVAMNLDTFFNNCSEIERNFFNFLYKDEVQMELKVLFCQYLIQLVGYQMLYYPKSSPFYAYLRIQFMFQEFNERFNWNLDLGMYNGIIKKNYSLKDPINLYLYQNLKNEEINNKKRRFIWKKKLKEKLKRFF